METNNTCQSGVEPEAGTSLMDNKNVNKEDQKEPKSVPEEQTGVDMDECSEYSDECSDESYEKEDETENRVNVHRFSPEAGKERLAKLPEKVSMVFQLQNIDKTFNAFVEELDSRCRDYEKNRDPKDYERILTQVYYMQCVNFRDAHFERRKAIDTVPVELTEYMKKTHMADILQTIIDVAQQNGYHARNNLESLKQQVQKNNQDEYELKHAMESWNSLQQLYKALVNLNNICNGIRRYDNPRNRKYNFNGRPKYRTHHYDDRPKYTERFQDRSSNQQHHFSGSMDPMQKKRYKPGTYSMQDPSQIRLRKSDHYANRNTGFRHYQKNK